MGVDICTNIGPYVECKIVASKPPSVGKILELITEKLFLPMGSEIRSLQEEKKIQIWLPNRRLDCAMYPEINLAQHRSSFHEVTSKIIAKQCAAFIQQFENEIEILHKFYGEENVTVKWGIIHYVY